VRSIADGFWGLPLSGFRVHSGFRVYAGAFYAAQRREKTLNPKPNTNHSLARDPKVRARRATSRAKARASRVASEINLANKERGSGRPQNPSVADRKIFTLVSITKVPVTLTFVPSHLRNILTRAGR